MPSARPGDPSSPWVVRADDPGWHSGGTTPGSASPRPGPAGSSDRTTEIAVLGVLVLLLGATSRLLRRTEHEPDEGEKTERGPAPERAVEARG